MSMLCCDSDIDISPEEVAKQCAHVMFDASCWLIQLISIVNVNNFNMNSINMDINNM